MMGLGAAAIRLSWTCPSPWTPLADGDIPRPHRSPI